MNDKKLAEAKLVNQAFKEATREIEHLGQELSAMQTFLAALLNKEPNRSVTITKAQIDELHAKDLCELMVQPQPDRSFVLTVVKPELKPEPKLIITSE